MKARRKCLKEPHVSPRYAQPWMDRGNMAMFAILKKVSHLSDTKNTMGCPSFPYLRLSIKHYLIEKGTIKL